MKRRPMICIDGNAKAKKDEEIAVASHSARSQVAGTVLQAIKKG